MHSCRLFVSQGKKEEIEFCWQNSRSEKPRGLKKCGLSVGAKIEMLLSLTKSDGKNVSRVVFELLDSNDMTNE